jgi:hypothetical protein
MRKANLSGHCRLNELRSDHREEPVCDAECRESLGIDSAHGVLAV